MTAHVDTICATNRFHVASKHKNVSTRHVDTSIVLVTTAPQPLVAAVAPSQGREQQAPYPDISIQQRCQPVVRATQPFLVHFDALPHWVLSPDALKKNSIQQE